MVVQQGMGEPGVPASWQRLLAERTRQAVETLAQVQGVAGLILCGSVGRGEAWPLSDIDLIPIYDDEPAETAVHEVEVRRVALLDWWMAEGYCPSLDVGKLRFTGSEAADAVALPPDEAARYLVDPRWFHSLDKGYGGMAVFDADGLTAALARWLTEARFTPTVVGGRLAINRRHLLAFYAQASMTLGQGDTLAAAIALRESLHVLMRYLVEGWGGRDTSFARFGTRFERIAAEQGEEEVAAEVMAMYGLTPDEVARRMEGAPEGIRHRHRLSFDARRLMAEPVSEEQDARDVLLVFSTMKIRRDRPPFEPWVGLEADTAMLGSRLDAYGRLLKRLKVM
jgi:hypothetical protein